MKKGKIAIQNLSEAYEALMRHRQCESQYWKLMMLWEPGDYAMEARIDRVQERSDYWREKYESYIC